MRFHSIIYISLVLIFLTGCRSVQLANYSASTSLGSITSESRPESSTTSDDHAQSPSRWPTRWGNNPDQRGTIIEMDPAMPVRPVHLSRFHQSRSTDIEYQDANQLASDIGIKRGFKFKSEGPGSFLFVPNPKNKPTPDITLDDGTLNESNTPDLAFKFVSASIAQSESTTLEPDEDFVLIQRTWFTFKDPKEKSSTDDSDFESKGTVVLLPGMFGTPDIIVDALENYWHNQNYSILRMRSQPSRFTEHFKFTTTPEKAILISGEVAQMNDDRVAEGAYATNAALDYIYTKRPDLKEKPSVLIGMSGGAMMLPTVYAYAPSQYDAAVLIAGGANFLKIAIESNYKSWIDAIVFDFDPDSDKSGRIDDQNLELFSQDYLRHSKLDAYYTATEMSDIPVLVLHASLDQAVPADSGQLLYKQLGEPERWSYPLGHELIFAGLPTQVTRIDRWITKNLNASMKTDTD
ncbi:MAG: alpha/beta hydrolase [Phycisphaerales bacterium]|nr:alpha/beta hydrolase [Phycisphaerales bacterium]